MLIRRRVVTSYIRPGMPFHVRIYHGPNLAYFGASFQGRIEWQWARHGATWI